MSNNNFLEDLQKLATGAFNSLSGTAKHFEEMVKNNVEAFLLKMDLVKKDELIATQEMARKALTKVLELEERLNNIEPQDKPNTKKKK